MRETESPCFPQSVKSAAVRDGGHDVSVSLSGPEPDGIRLDIPGAGS